MKTQKNYLEVINESVSSNLIRGLFKSLYLSAPCGKDRFQEISKEIGQERLMTVEGLTTLAERIGFEGITEEYDSNQNCYLDTTYNYK